MGKRPFYRKVRQTLHETVSDSGKSILCYRGNNDKIYYVASSNDPNVEPGGGMIEVTWQELKNKRDAGELIPGSLYRITDYQCTTTQENTKSAGHQFDIVLLALSENKLAEEGWAMMHDNIYDVAFDDGVTKKCYLYVTTSEREGDGYNIVDIETLLGNFFREDALNINEEQKTASFVGMVVPVSNLNHENLPYNYFQNSNLSAWKVWYCLDNDTSRFAWADDGEALSITLYEGGNYGVYVRYPQGDIEGKFAWSKDEEPNLYSDNPFPKIGDTIYTYETQFVDDYFVTAVSGLGRGVIYRLIDEWGNDVSYDFKNIMTTIGKNPDGYLFSQSNHIGDKDYSINGIFRNVSIPQYSIDINNEYIYAIELGILAPALREGERLQDIKIASGYLTSNGQIDQLSSHSIIGYSTEFSKT